MASGSWRMHRDRWSGCAFWLAAALAALVFLTGVDARPLVRNVKTNAEFKKLLKHHAEVTGLPVVVDFYSDGCGPCRMVSLPDFHPRSISRFSQDLILLSACRVSAAS
jgi:thiol-disulfide isomerase/thioredoxin